jgi:hypothetical protein
MGRITIAIYRPKTGKDEELLKLVREHMPILKKEKLITDRKAIVMQAADKAVVEIFEWRSAGAIEEAHKNPEVLKLWDRFNAICDFEIPVNVKEFHNMFSEFTPID